MQLFADSAGGPFVFLVLSYPLSVFVLAVLFTGPFVRVRYKLRTPSTWTIISLYLPAFSLPTVLARLCVLVGCACLCVYEREMGREMAMGGRCCKLLCSGHVDFLPRIVLT